VTIPVLGIVGAGQLARMTYQAVVGLDVPLHVFADRPDASAATIAKHVTVGSWDDCGALTAFAERCDVVTFDHELVDPAHLRALEDAGHVLRPGPRASLFAQDKLHQRTELARAGLPVPAFAAVSDPDDVRAFAEEHGWPLVLKSRRGGYDGRGVWVVDGPAEAHDVVNSSLEAGVELLVEEHVAIEREIAAALVRRPSGAQRVYPVTETVQRDGICVELIAPADVTPALAAEATALVERIGVAIDAVGLLAVELFVTDGHLIVNELALRPHNSMHWTIEGARTSQFQNHARAVLDWPLGDTAPTAPYAVTVNLLGPADGSDPRDRVADALGVVGVAVHLYDKAPRPGRKVGHVTALGDDRADTHARAWQAAGILTYQEEP
jgi:5-(carboxyamino)imidazole ribonucleotide synthase